MFTNFFGKSNPINFLLLGGYIVIGCVFVFVLNLQSQVTVFDILELTAMILVCIFMMLLLDFMIRKNGLTKANTYGVLLFTCFLVMFPVVFSEKNILLANLFLLLSLRRIYSLRSLKNAEKKILDASIWITIAGFFYFWSLLFFAVLFIAVLRKQGTSYKHLLIPVVGFFAVFVFLTTYHFLVFDSFQWFFDWKTEIGLDFSAYNSITLFLPAAIMTTLLIWTGIFKVFKIAEVSKKEKPNYILLFFVVITTIFISLASPEKTGAEVFFILAPLAIMTTNYMENVKDFWFKELLLWSIMLLPLLLFVL